MDDIDSLTRVFTTFPSLIFNPLTHASIFNKKNNTNNTIDCLGSYADQESGLYLFIYPSTYWDHCDR
jgi:hypothetical protein